MPGWGLLLPTALLVGDLMGADDLFNLDTSAGKCQAE